MAKLQQTFPVNVHRIITGLKYNRDKNNSKYIENEGGKCKK